MQSTPLHTNPQQYWTERYEANRTGWDIGYPAPALTEYADQLTDKSLRILIPGAGNAHEAEYLWRNGFEQVHILDISPLPLSRFQVRLPEFPSHQLIQADFFDHRGRYDLVLEQTFFCALPPDRRSDYAQQMSRLLPPGGKLVGLWFDFPLDPEQGPPFGGSRPEYLAYLRPYFKVHTFERATNSIKPRAGREWFGIFERL